MKDTKSCLYEKVAIWSYVIEDLQITWFLQSHHHIFVRVLSATARSECLRGLNNLTRTHGSFNHLRPIRKLLECELTN